MEGKVRQIHRSNNSLSDTSIIYMPASLRNYYSKSVVHGHPELRPPEEQKGTTEMMKDRASEVVFIDMILSNSKLFC